MLDTQYTYRDKLLERATCTDESAARYWQRLADDETARINAMATATTPATNNDDAVATLRTIIAHITHVRSGLERASDELRRRALLHDLSKLSPDEFAGFTRINRAAREHPYGSDEYRAGLRQEKPTVDIHYSRNTHHPEHYGVEYADGIDTGLEHSAKKMGWLDIVEMVCDWRAAYLTYGSQGTWEDNLQRQRERYKVDQWFTVEQWWLIEQVAAWVVHP